MIKYFKSVYTLTKGKVMSIIAEETSIIFEYLGPIRCFIEEEAFQRIAQKYVCSSIKSRDVYNEPNSIGLLYVKEK